MKFLQQNWTWMAVVVVPLLVRVINMSREFLMATEAIPTNGFSAKNHRGLRIPKSRILTHDALAKARRKIHENIEDLY